MIAGPRRIAAVAAILGLVFAFAACGDDNNNNSAGDTGTTETTLGSTTSSSATGSTTAGATNTISIASFKFSPDTLAVKGGTAVTVTNADSAPHTVTADDGSFDSGNVAGGATGTFNAPTKAGSYKYHCKIHANMEHKTLVVM